MRIGSILQGKLYDKLSRTPFIDLVKQSADDLLDTLGVLPSLVELEEYIKNSRDDSGDTLPLSSTKNYLIIENFEKKTPETQKKITNTLARKLLNNLQSDNPEEYLDMLKSVAEKPEQHAYVLARKKLLGKEYDTSVEEKIGKPYMKELRAYVPYLLGGDLYWSTRNRDVGVQDVLRVNKQLSAPEALFPGTEYHVRRSSYVIEQN